VIFHGVTKSRSTDDEGGDGPTFIKGLVAAVEGAAEMYDIEPQPKYGECRPGATSAPTA